MAHLHQLRLKYKNLQTFVKKTNYNHKETITEIEKKWYQPIWNWVLIFNQFITIFKNFKIQV
ncbi:hypothetical protein HMPREF9445_01453 [Bacteroides clarus YIT 12056]|uniref:Uncharacterized protein n=1 Tax=Bacteroides clarus YIT 12056 TaxID=762984 RepID=A0ABP2KU31_9BACE|nr:hypothetical protein HMPREF9445_01453 [Bacteroides clarus YIT 12056]